MGWLKALYQGIERPWAGRIIVHRMPNRWGLSLQETHAFGLGLYPGAIVVRVYPSGECLAREVMTVRGAGGPPDMQFYTYRPIGKEEADRHFPEVLAALGLAQPTIEGGST